MITIASMIQAARRVWWMPLIAMIVGGLIALLLLAVTTPTYEATAIIGPKKDYLNPGRSQSGLSSIIGAIQGTTNNPDLSRFDLVLRSDRLALEVSNSKDLTRTLFAERWDARAKHWKRRSGSGAALASLIGRPQSPEPSLDEVKGRLKQLISVETQQQLYRVIKVRTPDRARSQKLLAQMIKLSDVLLRHDDGTEINQMIGYSRQRLNEVAVSKQVEAIASALLGLEQQRMYMMAATYYSFDVLQSSIVEQNPSKPQPMLYLFTGLIFPPLLVIGILAALPQRRRN